MELLSRFCGGAYARIPIVIPMPETADLSQPTDTVLERERGGGVGGERHRQTDRQVNRDRQTETDRQMNRQTGEQTDRQVNRQTDRQVNRQTGEQTDR